MVRATGIEKTIFQRATVLGPLADDRGRRPVRLLGSPQLTEIYQASLVPAGDAHYLNSRLDSD
jgi:hypothetical protein